MFYVYFLGENTMDVSADLNELGRTPITVISAGVKSILDIGRTLEYLETQVYSYFFTNYLYFLTLALILTYFLSC